MRDVAVIGVGCTRFGELWESSFRDLIVSAGVEALEDAGVAGEDIDAMFVGNMSGGQFIKQEHIGSLIADYSGLATLSIPSVRVEGACASGGLAMHEAVLAIASGYYDIVVAAGVEKMTDVGVDVATDALAAASDREWEGFVGATFPGLYAMIARLHMHEHGTTREQLAHVAVKNHANAMHNPNAQFRRKITLEDVLSSPMVADPLRVLDCSPISDGAAAVVLAAREVADRLCETPVYVRASACATSSISLHNRRDITTLDATVVAAGRAFAQARLSPHDIDVAEVHDCFTIAEICAIEDIGFCKKGEGGPMTEEGQTQIDGSIPVNPSGGLKACGHPVGATGIKQVVEIVEQLRGEAGKRQVEGAEVGLTHNVGGSGGTAVIHILSR
ncbi:thiolase domain-containing protein [Methermicoccus shengliensis]|uniref:Thiolase domain-containing protein n=1 Tax=Methermicoccus shengliensis TaxID=660064 RepID=A0A832RXD2_9EURY|nr:thiolase domain-containing protein [Methermicoccus shengliensis]KUK04790.1 MAG: Acetyl-CoA acetyltransferase [Euryarchaeota archaeon 55_53]KUK30119.1 MAG: Acetyl-CoA acetyltransferase [Methanosarcinales archeaon 56_1174]MDI3487707.1 acetyl-CoA C-acetyltransferase [Methanosarcinales archaeon]MDN5295529.1 acetyl-CoA C-acetyltransferase [Methanosarcinales archaeon]HIH70290.1 thiolase domain-containing protein [Methermicoccus shengliensis]